MMITPLPSLGMQVPRLKRWTCSEFHRLGELGEFVGERAMLFDGVIFIQGPLSPVDVATMGLVGECLRNVFATGWCVRQQSPLMLGQDTDPEPDFAVVPGRSRDYSSHPTTANLVVEVSDTSFDFDTRDKRLIYARAGIPDYWVVDINGRRLHVYREPLDGDYAVRQSFGPDETVSPLAAPDRSIRVGDLLV